MLLQALGIIFKKKGKKMKDLTVVDTIIVNNAEIQFKTDGEEIFTDSLTIAKVFGKRHDHVLRDIANEIVLPKKGEITTGNTGYAVSTYIDNKNREYPFYYLTRDQFTLLVMGFTGAKARAWKIEYISAFNKVVDKALNIGVSMHNKIVHSNENHDFNFGGFSFKVNMVDGEPWFIASEVCSILGIKNARKSLQTIPLNERGGTTGYTLGGNQIVNTINEAGFYRLVFRSKKKEAETFKDWVCTSVLPSIRKTGSYSIDTDEAYKHLMADFKESTLNIRVPHIIDHKSVYIMEDTNGYFKLGVSKNPDGRLKQLSCGNTDIKLIHQTALLESAHKIETYAHNSLTNYCVQGEWFNCPLELIKSKIQEALVG